MEQHSDRYAWRLIEPGKPLELVDSAGRPPEAGEVLIEVAGCGLCHTDFGFLDGTVKTRAQLPLVLGHEISGRVTEAGEGVAISATRAEATYVPVRRCPETISTVASPLI